MSSIDSFIFIAAILIVAFQLNTNKFSKYIVLQRHKFWELVRSQSKPVVLLTSRGFFVKRLCYVYPYQGVLFYTDAANTEAPEGVTLISTAH